MIDVDGTPDRLSLRLHAHDPAAALTVFATALRLLPGAESPGVRVPVTSTPDGKHVIEHPQLTFRTASIGGTITLESGELAILVTRISHRMAR